MITIGSLFSGIGGLELGLERGLHQADLHATTLWQVEQSDYARKVLAKHWPGALRFDDVRAVGEDLPPVDLICGGFPCQDISVAGNQAGINPNTRSGLFYELARIVGMVRPRYVVLENVSAILTSNGGNDLSTVLGTMAALGYDVWWDCIPAAAVGAPHRRDRWFAVCWRPVANTDNLRVQSDRGSGRMGGPPRAREEDQEERQRVRNAAGCGRKNVADTDRREPHPFGWRQAARAALRNRGWTYGCAEPRLGRAADGLSRGLDQRVERPWQPWEGDTPRTAPRQPNTKDRLRALGNAVVPQVAEVIGSFVAALHKEAA